MGRVAKWSRLVYDRVVGARGARDRQRDQAEQDRQSMIAWEAMIALERLHRGARIHKESARERQRVRLGRGPARVNARMTPRQLARHCGLAPGGRELLAQAARRLGLSPRAHDRVLKVARTLADLAGAEAIAVEHLAEALAYRTLDRGTL